MTFRDLPQIRNKYNVNITLTTYNIKDIYFITNCNNYSYDMEITEFLDNNYTETEVMCWNNEYINDKIKEYYNAINTEDDDIDYIFNIYLNIQLLCGIYTDRRETYEKIIDLIKTYHSKFGYFMYYPFCSADEDDENADFYPMLNVTFPLLYINNNLKHGDSGINAKRCHGCEERYLEDDGYSGLLPRLYKLGYYDLFEKVITDIILPVSENYLTENNRIFKKHQLYYVSKKSIQSFVLNKMIKSYAEKFSIALPEEFKKYL